MRRRLARAYEELCRQVAVSRMTPERMVQILDSPATSSWLAQAVDELLESDPIDAAHDAELLAAAMRARMWEALAGHDEEWLRLRQEPGATDHRRPRDHPSPVEVATSGRSS